MPHQGRYVSFVLGTKIQTFLIPTKLYRSFLRGHISHGKFDILEKIRIFALS